MKVNILKKLIKEAVKEAIQEELKEILLEVIRTPKTQPITESHLPSPVNLSSKPAYTPAEVRKSYMDVLGDMSNSFTSKDVPQPFNPGVGGDPVNGPLPDGELSMEQITNLMMSK
tara:strand:+ start:288 stop:632 length:345 start_codon:yes stop_codon:yes gene_type:complete